MMSGEQNKVGDLDRWAAANATLAAKFRRVFIQ